MQLDLDRTIVAVGSPLAPSRRAIVRISGSQTRELLRRSSSAAQECVDRDESGDIDPRTPKDMEAYLSASQAIYFRMRFDLDWHDRWIDAGVYYWPDHRSFTGEPCAELHFLGSLPLVDRVVHRLLQLGASPADRGEFSLRSFLAGKIDLVQAEAVLGVIESVDGEQLAWSLSQLGGNLSQLVRELRNELVGLLAELEAGLDFVEEDIEFITAEQLSERLGELIGRIESLNARLDDRGAPVRRPEIALAGLPNAGKSSLFNALVGRDRAIVSTQAGTTRDAVTAMLPLGDSDELAITLIDTAGIEQLDEESPRASAQLVLRERMETCDVVILCIDLTQLPSSDWIDEQLRWLATNSRPVLLVGTKSDLPNEMHPPIPFSRRVSIHSIESIDGLRNQLRELVASAASGRFTKATHHTAIRCRLALSQASDSLRRARQLVQSDEGHELVAGELRYGLDELASIIGEVHNDDILGQIFSRFCIGK